MLFLSGRYRFGKDNDIKIMIDGTREELCLAVPRISKLIQVQSATLSHPDEVSGIQRYTAEGDLIQDRQRLLDELYDFILAADEENVDVEHFDALLAALDRVDPLPEIQASPDFLERLKKQIQE